ncbi:uncharacterized protein BX664DRAFT_336112 [Halteromyces radiatus]|uniref:uncharacterized protein n=1 Tax=Halteromyces radiatus TaxID=101107 RepID=UPI002220164B|nr:uncharacterized protein BX664DRAFT_336112 [Halteromyces radiatus]KAI8086541.1 hypothetical protein BX664DRAFT_336112 [Halteromyces radiatus]
MSSSRSIDRLLQSLLFLSTSLSERKSSLCSSCSRLRQKQRFSWSTTNNRLIWSRLSTTGSFYHTQTFTPCYSSNFPMYSLLLGKQYMMRAYSTTNTNVNNNGNVDTTLPSHYLSKQRDATTSIAIIQYAKKGRADMCLQYYLRLLETQGTLPSHEALHQLARVLYIKQHVRGLYVLHDTLFVYHKLHPPSGRQSRNLIYIYTMLINLLSQRLPVKSSIHPNNGNKTGKKIQKQTKQLAETTKTVIQLCQEMHQLGLTGTRPFYNSLVAFCVKKNDMELAWSLCQELTTLHSPTAYTYSILLHMTRKQKDYDQMMTLLDEMEKDGIVPDHAMVSTVLLALCDQRQYKSAVNLMNRLAYHTPDLVGPKYKNVLLQTLYRHHRLTYPVLPSTTKKNKKRQRRHSRKKYHHIPSNVATLSSTSSSSSSISASTPSS